jgi:indolepyruvate ferredoxin oxidoreductase beta subunit
MNVYKIHLTGVGGQGTIKTSTIIGEAAIKRGLNVVMSEVHGMAQRGGVVTTDLKIGDAYSPLIENGDADLVIGFEPAETLRSISKVGEKTFVITNSARIIPFTVGLGLSKYPPVEQIINELKSKIKHLFVINAEEIANKAGNIMSLNMVLLGAATAIPNFPIGKDEIIQSMKENLPPKTIEVNLKAFELGFNEVSR